MKRPEPLEIFQPTSVKKASAIIKEKGPSGRFLAGGTDLIIAIKEKGWCLSIWSTSKDTISLSYPRRAGRRFGYRLPDDDAGDRDLPLNLQEIPFSGAERCRGRVDPDQKPRNHWRQHGKRHTIGGCSPKSFGPGG